MRRVIDGKVFDTKTATAVAEWESPHGVGDFERCEETLYKTSKGNFFIAGSGGPMTRWSEPARGGGLGAGRGIEPVSPATALAWCEMKDVDADVIEAHFEVEEA
jgi:hypothetical protein